MAKPIAFILVGVLIVGAAIAWWRARRGTPTGVTNYAHAMQPPPPGAPKDQMLPVPSARESEYKALIERARAGLPEVRRRFRAGLPSGQSLFVTTLLQPPGKRGEQIFVQVLTWEDDRGPVGVVASHIQQVEGVHYGDQTMVLESAILDWTISRPDGSEEGNALGKFLEGHQQ